MPGSVFCTAPICSQLPAVASAGQAGYADAWLMEGTAAWAEDASLEKSLELLPASLDRALQQDWSAGIEALKDADRTLVIARGRLYVRNAEQMACYELTRPD